MKKNIRNPIHDGWLLAWLSTLFFTFSGTGNAAPGEHIVHRHETTAGNTAGHITTIDDARFNDRRDLKLFLTHHWKGTHLDHPLGAWYNGSKWTVFTEDHSRMPVGLFFHVIACEPGSHVFNHVSSAKNSRANQTILDHPLLNGNKNAKLVVTHDWTVGKTYHEKHVGVWYDGNN